MIDHADNVIPFRSKGTREIQSMRHEPYYAALRQLDELSYRLEQFSPQPSWSTERWMADSTSFRMRLGRARNGLRELATLNPDFEQRPVRWAIKFNSTRFEAERRLRDIDACLGRLRCADVSSAEIARETRVFTLSRSQFLRALEKVRVLIDERLDSR
jgi:hypothetical protein